MGPILEKRTPRVLARAFVCPIHQNRTRGVCVRYTDARYARGAGMVYAWFMGTSWKERVMDQRRRRVWLIGQLLGEYLEYRDTDEASAPAQIHDRSVCVNADVLVTLGELAVALR